MIGSVFDSRGGTSTAMAPISEGLRAELRFFAFYLANQTLYVDEFGDLGEYWPSSADTGSALEMIFSVFMNNLDIGPDGQPMNSDHATRRAAQYIRQYCQGGTEADPPFEDWQTELHGP
jgi:hypothetical protein